MKRGEKWLSEKLRKNLTWKIVGPSHSRYVPLRAGLPLPSSCCKGVACLPRSHYKGEAGKARVQNCVSVQTSCCIGDKAKPAFRDRNYKEETSSSKLCMEG